MKENILVYRNTLTGTCTLLPELYPALHCACAVKIKNYSLKTPFLLEKIYCKMKENMLFYKNTQSSHCACADKIMNYPMKTPYFLEKMYNKMKEQIVFYKNSLIGTCTLLPALCPALHCACAVKITNYSLKKLFLLERIYYKMKENILVYRNTLTGTCTLLAELYPALHCACAVKIKNYSLKTPFLLEKIYCKMKENMLFYKNTQSSHCACADKIMNYPMKTPYFLEKMYNKMKEQIVFYKNSLIGTCTLLPTPRKNVCACACLKNMEANLNTKFNKFKTKIRPFKD